MTYRIALIAGIGLCFCTWSKADDWPQFLGPQRNGASKETVMAWPKAGPPAVWHKDVGAGFSGPVVVGDKLILFHRVGDEEVVECLSTAKGAGIWKFAYATAYEDDYNKGNGPRATPTIADKRVVTLGADGWLHCLDLEKGSKLWAMNVIEEYQVPRSFFGVGSSPVVENGLILVNVGGKEAGIVAFDMETGKERWRATQDGASYASPVISTGAGVRQAVFFTREGVVILDPKFGTVRHRQRWRARINASVNAATPLLIGETAFFSSSYETGALLLRLKKDGAEEIWNSDEVMSNHYSTCIHHESHLYGFDGRQEAGPSFRCVDIKTRKIMWNQDRFGCGSMILADGKLIVMTERGELILVEATPRQYKELARGRVLDQGTVRAQIALANGRLYARDEKQLVCWKLD